MWSCEQIDSIAKQIALNPSIVNPNTAIGQMINNASTAEYNSIYNRVSYWKKQLAKKDTNS